MKIEVDRENFATWLASASELKNVIFQAVDLKPHDQVLAALLQAETSDEACVFLGCPMGPALALQTLEHHALIFPELPGLVFRPYREELYSPQELYRNFQADDPASYRLTPDRLIYESFMELDEQGWPLRPPRYKKVGMEELMARRLHDHFISQELEAFLRGFDPRLQGHKRGVVAIMGGHDVQRDHASFLLVAQLARRLARKGFLVASGGGPGLMEAANLGAYFAPMEATTLDLAVEHLTRAPAYNDRLWLATGWEVLQQHPTPDLELSTSLGIPTWFYGHEPPNVFATHIAKYFENSLREEGLLAIATHGILFANGNAGTVQEIFQDACQNYYTSYGQKSPMVLLGRQFWEMMPDEKGAFLPRSKPAWPLLRHLARVGGFESLICLTDDPDEALEVFDRFRVPGQPEPARGSS